MTNSRGNLIIIGASARAAAQSAILAGYEPWCIDLFADRDLQAIAPVKRCPKEKWPQGILELMKDAPPGPVLLTGAMENHVELLREIERSRVLVTGPVSAIAQLRSSRAAYRALLTRIENWCEVMKWRDGVLNVPALHWEDDVAAALPDRWQSFLEYFAGVEATFLVKPRRSGGGRGIRIWRRGEEVVDDEFVQLRVPGRTYSGLFSAAAGKATLLGVTEQLVGHQAFGAESSFAYVGNIYPAAIDEDVWLQFQCAGRALAEWSGFSGVFGIDAVLPTVTDVRMPLNHGRIHIVDINPRYPASAELLERCHTDLNVLDGFASELERGKFTLQQGQSFVGKAIIHAKQRCRMTPEIVDAMGEAMADIPELDELFERGQPICTVFADEVTRHSCFDGLRDMAEKVYTRLQPA